MKGTVTKAALKLSSQAEDILNRNQPQKVGVYLKLDQAVVKWFRAGGPGYQRRINEVLRRFVSAVDKELAEAKPSRLEQAQALFEKYHTQCFWHMRPDLIVTEADIEQIVKGLKLYGGRSGYLEAQKLCR